MRSDWRIAAATVATLLLGGCATSSQEQRPKILAPIPPANIPNVPLPVQRSAFPLTEQEAAITAWKTQAIVCAPRKGGGEIAAVPRPLSGGIVRFVFSASVDNERQVHFSLVDFASDKPVTIFPVTASLSEVEKLFVSQNIGQLASDLPPDIRAIMNMETQVSSQTLLITCGMQ